METLQNIVPILLGTVILSLNTGNVAGQWMLQSQNYNHKSIGYDTSAEHFPAIIMDRGRRFIPRQPGLTGESNTVSFESADYPGRYLRHYGYQLYTEYDTNPRNPDIFHQDATFAIYPNRYFRGYYVFESVNYRNYFIRHKDSTVLITNSSDNSQWFEADASFRFIQSGIMLQPRRQEVCVKTHCKVGGTIGDKANMQDQGLYFSMVSPGPNGIPHSVGFELQDSPGYYLRDYAQYAYFDAANTSRSPYTYMDDVNFALRFNRFSQGYYAIESIKYPGRFLRAVGLSVKFDPQDGSNYFGGDASFRIVNGPVYLESKNMPDHKMGLDGDSQALMTTEGYRYNLFYPGLTGAEGTVSFESYVKPGFYLRHYDFNIDLEDISNPRNPGIFNEDATFFLRKDVWHNDYILFESLNYRNHSIRHSDYRLMIGYYEDTETFREDACYKMVDAPLNIDSDNQNPSSGSDAGKIVGAVIGVLVAIALIVAIVFYTNKKFAWVDTLKFKAAQRGSSLGNEGGLENPSYPVGGYSADGETAKESKSKSASSTMSSPPTTPTTPTGDPFDNQDKPNPVRRLSRSLSNSMSRLKRSMTGEDKEEVRHMEVPEGFGGLNIQDFQPATDYGEEGGAAAESKGNFGNPMYGLKQLTPTGDGDKDDSWQTQQRGSLHRPDSLIDTSPTLFDNQQQDFSKAMSFFDETLEMAEVKETAKELEKAEGTAEKSGRKKLSPGITPIGEDDLWDIGDA